MAAHQEPVRVALVNDYDVVVVGVAHMLEPYADRVVVAELDTVRPVHGEVDVVLYDSFARSGSEAEELPALIANPGTQKLAIYTWNFQHELVRSARKQGVTGYLSKALPARDLVSALEAVHAGEVVISDPPRGKGIAGGLDWPGRREGLTGREAEVLALITQGRSNAEVAELTCLSPNTVKAYIRSVYRKIDVASRTQAVLWGVTNGFDPDRRRLDR
jgi:DNA-binding NarL/FixJ family response regulator